MHPCVHNMEKFTKPYRIPKPRSPAQFLLLFSVLAAQYLAPRYQVIEDLWSHEGVQNAKCCVPPTCFIREMKFTLQRSLETASTPGGTSTPVGGLDPARSGFVVAVNRGVSRTGGGHNHRHGAAFARAESHDSEASSFCGGV